MLSSDYIEDADIPVNPALCGPASLADLGQQGALRLARATEEIMGRRVMMCMADSPGPAPCPCAIDPARCPNPMRRHTWHDRTGNPYVSCNSPVMFHLERLSARLRHQLPKRIDPMVLLAERLTGPHWLAGGKGGAA